mgnify:CR=1 FL=1
MIEKVPVFKVWVMSFIDTSEVEIFNSRESAYEAAKDYVMQEVPEYIEKDMAALDESYNEGKEYFCIDDFLWVDPYDILAVAKTENERENPSSNRAVTLKNMRS